MRCFKKIFISCLMIGILLGPCSFCVAKEYRTETVYDPISVPAATIRKTPVYESDLTTRKKVSGKDYSLAKSTDVTVLGEKTSDNKKWFAVSFSVGNETIKGTVRNKYIVLKNKEPVSAAVTGVTGLKTIRAAADKADALKSDGKKVTVVSGTAVRLVRETAVGTAKWYKISLTFNKKEVSGYIKPKYIKLKKNKRTVKVYALTAEEFEKEMTDREIPDVYKPYLRTLHEQYPFWEFRAFKTGLSWQTVLKQESKTGRNLIPNSKSEAWKSKESDAYDSKTGKWKVFDGSSWVAASKEAVAYYMDPRNFLNERTIYQFELQEYQKDHQKAAAVDQIFSNTPFAGKRFSYVDPLTGKTAKMTYTNAYIAAAKESKVSPIHLASRTKQEVVTSATTTSGAVTGKNKNYPGIFNFYNIGATSGTNPMENGLKWASTGNTYMRPWTDPYRSIVGGALYIGTGYINHGQNTIYLEKFNVTSYERYTHQYMTNVEAAYSEALKIQKAYNEAGLLKKTPLVFSFPVYDGMPAEACPAPQ